MNTSARTLIFVAVAAVTTAAAIGVRIASRPASVEGFSDVGQLFFPDFRDPLKATSLKVVKYDAETREPVTFKVMRNDQGLWVIPSHHDYPAEAKERLAKTAAGLYGLKKTALQTRSKDDWARYGVVDPEADATASLESSPVNGQDTSRGTRITLSDASGNALVDLIVGRPVKGQSKHFYVREPEKNSVFIAKVETDLSVKFSDWIEPDLLKLNQFDINSLVIDNYSIDEERGAVLKGEVLTLRKDKATSKWSLEGLNPDLEVLKEAPVSDLTRNLDQLKIVGVRPKPAGVNADLTVTREVAQNPLLRQALEIDMQRKGFFIAGGADGSARLYSNEGELIAGTSTGVKYTLYFGEIARGTGKDIEIGLNETTEATSNPPGETPSDAATGENTGDTNTGSDATGDSNVPDSPKTPETGPRRYLLVKAEYDESLLDPKPVAPVPPEKPDILKEAAPEGGAENPASSSPDGADASAEQTAPAGPQPETGQAAPAPADVPAVESNSVEPADPKSPETETSENPRTCDESPADEPASEADSGDPAAPATPVQDTTTAESSGSQDTTTAESSVTTDAGAAAPSPASEATASDPAAATTPGTPEPATDSNSAASPPEQQTPETPKDPKAEAQQQYDKALGEYEAAKSAYETALREWESKAKDGRKRADELALRFGAWYYVISAESFEKFKVARAGLVGPKEEPKPASGAAAPAAPDSSPGPGFDVPAGDMP